MNIEILKGWIGSFITKGKNFAIRNPVLANLISMFLGGFVISICLPYPNASSVSANIVIAIATCSATAIHYASTRNQRNDRIWDMNKDILLDLASLLSEVIEELNEIINSAHSAMGSEYSNSESQKGSNEKNVFVELDLKINNALNVYKPLLGKDLVQKISNFKSMTKQIEHEVFEEDLDNLEAYEKSLPLAEELQKEILKFIEEFSGVRKIM